MTTVYQYVDYVMNMGVLSKVIKGTAVILIAMAILSIGSKLISGYFKRVVSKRKNVNKIKTVQKIIKNIFQLVVVFISTAIFLDDVLGVDISSILTVAGVSGLAVGFASQTIIKDFLAGIMVLMEDTITIGDLVEMNGYKGTVEDISLRSISLRDESDVLHVIPNNLIRNFSNHSRKTKSST